MADSDMIKNEGLWELLVHITTNINYKLILGLFILFMFITSNVFNERVVKKFGNTFDGGVLTSWGVAVQGMFLVIAYMLTDLIIGIGIL